MCQSNPNEGDAYRIESCRTPVIPRKFDTTSVIGPAYRIPAEQTQTSPADMLSVGPRCPTDGDCLTSATYNRTNA